MKRSLIVGGLAACLLSVTPAAPAATVGIFSVNCPYSHTLADDPIVVPGHHGGSHLHDFFGNETTRADSTASSMRAGGTTCRLVEDTAGYWNPTAFLGETQLTPTRVILYYRGTTGTVSSFPADLQMLAGNKGATSRYENPRVKWDCTGPSAPMTNHPYDCGPYSGRVVARIEFPSCWDGEGLGPTSVAYPARGSCAGSFPVSLPRIAYRVTWPIQNPCLPGVPCTPEAADDASIQLRLSSGAYYTMHADFWNTWQQAKLDQLVESCLNAHVACGAQAS